MHARTRRFLQERMLTTRELSALIGVPAITIQQWAHRGKVDYVLKGRTYLFDRIDFVPATSPEEAVPQSVPAKVTLLAPPDSSVFSALAQGLKGNNLTTAH